MHPSTTLAVWLLVLVAAAPLPAADPPDTAELGREPSWSIPSATETRARIADWLAASGVDAPRRAQLDETLASQPDTLDGFMEVALVVDGRVAALRDAVARGPVTPADVGWLDDPATPAVERDALRLWLGRHLVRLDRFDDALPLLADLDVATALDPTALLFHRAACQHWLLDADAALATLDQLLEREPDIPVRYARLAGLMRADLAALENESLDHIARRMRDITRRLDLGRAGSGTRGVQDGVIASLDKLIKELEDQQQQQQQQQGGGAGGAPGSGGTGRPMDDSRAAGGKGPGEVQKRDIGSADGWGDLPPQEREESLQQIGREFPPHYREAIEQYFKRLASGKEDE